MQEARWLIVVVLWVALVGGAASLGAEGTDQILFGYSGIRTEEDLREVSAFSNVVLFDPLDPGFPELTELARDRDMRIAIGWDKVLFDTSRRPFRLHADYRQRFESLVNANPRRFRDLLFHVPVDEPYWNGLTDAEVLPALELMQEHFPGVPTLIVMAWPTLDSRQEAVPSDWVAFDRYTIADPLVDPVYQQYWNQMRALNPGKPILVVADGFYSLGHIDAGISRADMGAVLRSYRDLFLSEPNAVVLGVFTWTDSPGLEGTRSLPAQVIHEHAEVGAALTGRCGLPPGAEPLSGETILWLRGCRFFARVEIDDPRTEVEAGTGVPLTDESGAFWFFDAGNLEVTLKVLDGRAVNQHFWVYLSDTTDIDYRLEIHDTVTGDTWRHENLGGRAPVRRDILAFPVSTPAP